MKVRFNKNYDIGRVVKKIVYTILALWVGGVIITELGNTVLGSCSPFFKGLTLIGWEVGNNATATGAGVTVESGCETSSQIVYDTSGAGILTVIGLIGISSIVLEFVDIKF